MIQNTQELFLLLVPEEQDQAEAADHAYTEEELVEPGQDNEALGHHLKGVTEHGSAVYHPEDPGGEGVEDRYQNSYFESLLQVGMAIASIEDFDKQVQGIDFNELREAENVLNLLCACLEWIFMREEVAEGSIKLESSVDFVFVEFLRLGQNILNVLFALLGSLAADLVQAVALLLLLLLHLRVVEPFLF